MNGVIVCDEWCLGVGCLSRLAIAFITCVCCLQDRKSIVEYHVTYFNRPKIFRVYNMLRVKSLASDRQPHRVMGWGVYQAILNIYDI